MPHYPTVARVPLQPSGNEGGRLSHGSMSFSRQAILDIDGDGFLDIIEDLASEVWNVYPGTGRGGFGERVEWKHPFSVRPSLSSSEGIGSESGKSEDPSRFLGFRTVTAQLLEIRREWC